MQVFHLAEIELPCSLRTKAALSDLHLFNASIKGGSNTMNDSGILNDSLTNVKIYSMFFFENPMKYGA